VQASRRLKGGRCWSWTVGGKRLKGYEGRLEEGYRGVCMQAGSLGTLTIFPKRERWPLVSSRRRERDGDGRLGRRRG
jgi:hypothetical protein